MSLESKKTNQIRTDEFKFKYLSKKVLDIGAGPDPVVSGCTVFDVEDGDANNINSYFKKETFDTVYSSHCLEHMHNARSCLKQWWGLVKPGGYMVTVVPHEELYEQHIWPSVFNEDHKWTFRAAGKTSWSPVSINIVEETEKLNNAVVLNVETHDNNYDYELVFPLGKTPKNRHSFWNRQATSLAKRLPKNLGKAIIRHQVNRGYPYPQTLKSGALAQIQIVAQKYMPS